VPGKPIDELERDYGITGSIKLASNENPTGPPASALTAIREVLPELASYPDGSGYYLKRKLAKRFAIDPGCITLGNGSNDILVLLAEAFLTADVEAVYDQHSFIVYRLAVQAADARARVVPSNPAEHSQPYGHDLDAFGTALSERTRLVFLANPNNPTGTWVTSEKLHAYLRRVPKHAIVVVDEAYGEYVGRDDYPDTLGWLTEFPNLVVTRTFSKIYGLAGLRIGYAISHPQIAELLNRVRQPFNTNSLAQVAAAAALDDNDFLERSRGLNLDGLRQLTEGFSACGFAVLPSIGNFVLVDMGRPAGPVYEILLRAGIIVRTVANYGLPNHLRVTVGLPEQNDRLLTTIRNNLGEILTPN